MTKIRTYIIGAIILVTVIGSSPMFVSWVVNRNSTGSARAQYVYGLGRIAKWFGNKQAERRLTHHAELLYEHQVELIFDFSNRDEMDAIFDQLPMRASWIEAGNIESTTSPNSLQIIYEVPASIREEFEAAVQQARDQYREAQQSVSG